MGKRALSMHTCVRTGSMEREDRVEQASEYGCARARAQMLRVEVDEVNMHAYADTTVCLRACGHTHTKMRVR